MFLGYYLRTGVVYIPTWGRMPNGAGREIEPVTVVPVSDTAALRGAFRETIARGNPSVPQLRGGDWPEPVVLKYAGVKSLSAFAKSARMWHLIGRDSIYELVGMERRTSTVLQEIAMT